MGELLVKGFTLDDERIKAGRTIGADYFDELLARIRDIRASQRLFYQKITDIYATSIDYDPQAEMTQLFFQTVQNKMHWAAHGHTLPPKPRSREPDSPCGGRSGKMKRTAVARTCVWKGPCRWQQRRMSTTWKTLAATT